MRFLCRGFPGSIGILSWSALLIGVVGIWAEVQALPPDVGIITRLSGDVTYRNEDYQRTPEKAQAFMRIRKGDHFKMPAEAMVQLIYFQSGRKETWKGPAVIIVDDIQSRTEDKKGPQTQPEVTIMPKDTSQTMRGIPILLRQAGLGRSGAMQIRGIEESPQGPLKVSQDEQVVMEKAKENYRSLRNQSEADDITPEMYLLGIMVNYDKFEEMEQVLKEAQKIQPMNPVLIKLEAWVDTKKKEKKGK